MKTIDLIQVIESKTNLKYNKNDTDTFEGASLIRPTGRVFKDVVSLDFRSFYPSIIVSYNLLGDEMSEWLLEMFKKKQNGDKKAKLAMNKIYGLMKHFDIQIAENIARIGREWIKLLINIVGKDRVIYSHTDNIMVSDMAIDNIYDLIMIFKKQIVDYIIPNPIVGIEIENKFKYIYFKEDGSGGFVMNNYIGINHDNTWVMKGNWKPSMWEISRIKFIQHLLERGENTITPERIEEYLSLYKLNEKDFDNYINTKDLSIVRVEQNKINLD